MRLNNLEPTLAAAYDSCRPNEPFLLFDLRWKRSNEVEVVVLARLVELCLLQPVAKHPGANANHGAARRYRPPLCGGVCYLIDWWANTFLGLLCVLISCFLQVIVKSTQNLSLYFSLHFSVSKPPPRLQEGGVAASKGALNCFFQTRQRGMIEKKKTWMFSPFAQRDGTLKLKRDSIFFFSWTGCQTNYKTSLFNTIIFLKKGFFFPIKYSTKQGSAVQF